LINAERRSSLWRRLVAEAECTIERLRERIDLVIVPAFWELQDLAAEVFKPRRALRQKYSTGFDSCYVRVHADDFVGTGFDGNGVDPVSLEILDQRHAGIPCSQCARNYGTVSDILGVLRNSRFCESLWGVICGGRDDGGPSFADLEVRQYVRRTDLDRIAELIGSGPVEYRLSKR
jgi:hypothetical protein